LSIYAQKNAPKELKVQALPFIVYEDLVQLEKNHGVDVGDAYTTQQQFG
jgi:hypothetical protein